MTARVQYVDTDVAPGGDGTIGAPYDKLSVWEAQNIDLVAAGDTMTVYCSGAAPDTTLVNLTGWVTGASNWIKIIGDHANKDYSTTGYHIEHTITASYQSSVTINQLNATVSRLQIKTTTTTSHVYCRALRVLKDNCPVEKTILVGVLNSGSDCNGIEVVTANAGAVRNNLARDFVTTHGGNPTGIEIDSTSGTMLCQNNTVKNCRQGIAAITASKVIATNNISQLNTLAGGDYVGTFHTTSDYNCGDDGGQTGGANDETGTVSFESGGFQPTAADTVSTPSADLTGTFTDDLANTLVRNAASFTKGALIATGADYSPQIVNTDGDDTVLNAQASVVITTTGITTAGADVNLKVNDDSITVAQAVDSTTADSITLTSIALGNNPFTAAGRQLQIEVDDGIVAAVERNVTVNPATGKSMAVVDAAPVVALVNGYITSVLYGYTGTAPAIGDQIEYDTNDSEGNAVTMANGSGGIDGSFSIAGQQTPTTFAVRWWNPTDYWSNSATITVSDGVIVSVDVPQQHGRGRTSRFRRL